MIYSRPASGIVFPKPRLAGPSGIIIQQDRRFGNTFGNGFEIAGQLREIYAVSLIVGVIRAYIDTGFFYIERFKFQIFMPKNVPERRQLTLRNIDDADFRLPAGHPVADLFDTAFLMLDNVFSAPMPIKIHQKVRDHIAGVSCQRKFFAIVVRRHRADQRSVFQNDFCIIAHGLTVGRDPQSPTAPLHQFSPQLFFQ